MKSKVNMLKLVTLGLLAAVATSPALAAVTPIDTAPFTEGVSAAQTAILAVIAALTALSMAVFGVSKVYAFIKRRAGA